MLDATQFAEYKIELMNKIPIHVHPFPIPNAKRQTAEKEFLAMLEVDVRR